MRGLFFTPWHEWVKIEDGTAAVGLTGVGLTGDVVYIELPELGSSVEKGKACALVETVKVVREVLTPFTGKIAKINDAVFDDPDMISREPMETWLFKLDIADADTQGLLTEKEYAELKQLK